MSNAIKGLGLVIAVATAGLVWGAEHRATESATPGIEKEIRTAEREVAVGTYTCFGAGTGEVTVTVNYEGTTGVFAQPTGFSVKLTTVVNPADADAACQTLTDDFVTLAGGLSCVVAPVRLIGSTRDTVVVCTGNRTQVIDAVGLTASFVATNVRPAP